MRARRAVGVAPSAWRRPIAVGGAVGLILGATACPLPGRYVEHLAPPIAGFAHTGSGAPLAGVALTVSEHQDCHDPTATATTDSTGTFRFAASDRPRKLAWIGPFEFPPPREYYLCIGGWRAVYRGAVPRDPLNQPPLRQLSLECWGERTASGLQLQCADRGNPP